MGGQIINSDHTWHRDPVDKYGNVQCITCHKIQSPAFKACIFCCTHEVLELDETWDYGWHLDAYCSECGKNHGSDNEYLIDTYKLVKK